MQRAMKRGVRMVSKEVRGKREGWIQIQNRHVLSRTSGHQIAGHMYE